MVYLRVDVLPRRDRVQVGVRMSNLSVWCVVEVYNTPEPGVGIRGSVVVGEQVARSKLGVPNAGGETQRGFEARVCDFPQLPRRGGGVEERGGDGWLYEGGLFPFEPTPCPSGSPKSFIYPGRLAPLDVLGLSSYCMYTVSG